MNDPTQNQYDLAAIYAVEASNGWCPDRTVWVYDGVGMWHCTCCSEYLPWDKLIDPQPVTA